MELETNKSELGVIFDCDGVLADSMDAWRDLEAHLAQSAGKELTHDDVDKLTTMTIPECGAYIHERFGLGKNDREIIDTICEFMMDFYAHRSTPRPGALEFVQGLAECGIPMAVASSTPQALLEAAMDHMGFDDYVCAVISVDLVGASKRDPDVYDRAREVLGTVREQTWGFEDSIYAIRTLNRAGYRTYAIYDCDKSGTYDVLSREADIAARSFTDINAESFLEAARKF